MAPPALNQLGPSASVENCAIGQQQPADQQQQFVQQQQQQHPYQHHYVHHSLCYPATSAEQHTSMSLSEPQQHYYQYCATSSSNQGSSKVLDDTATDYPQPGGPSPSSSSPASSSSSTSTSTSTSSTSSSSSSSSSSASTFNETSGGYQQQLPTDNTQSHFNQQVSSHQQLIDHQLVISSGGNSNSSSRSSGGARSGCGGANQNDSGNSLAHTACGLAGEGAGQEQLAYSYEEPAVSGDCLAATTSWTVMGGVPEQQVSARCEQADSFGERTSRERPQIALEQQQQTYSQQHLAPSAHKSALALGATITGDYNNNRHQQQQFASMGEQVSTFNGAHLAPLMSSHNANYQCNNQEQQQHYQQQFYSQDQNQKYQYYGQNEPPVHGTFELLPALAPSPQLDNQNHHRNQQQQHHHHHHHHHQRQSPTSSSAATIHHHHHQNQNQNQNQNQQQQLVQQNYDQYQQQLYLHHQQAPEAAQLEQQQQLLMTSNGDYPTTKSTSSIHQQQHQDCEQHYGQQPSLVAHHHHQLEGYTSLEQPQHHLGHMSLSMGGDYGSHQHCANSHQQVVSTTTTFVDLECPLSGEPTTTMGLQHKARPLKGRRGRPRKKGLRSKNKVNGKLWEFIRDLLLSERTNPSFIRWERREDGVFKFVQSDKVAKMWGERKQNPKMTYEKLSRAMRYYYKSKVLLPVFGRRLVYKFGPNATGWMASEAVPIY